MVGVSSALPVMLVAPPMMALASVRVPAAQLETGQAVRSKGLGEAARLSRKERQLHTTCVEGESFYVSSPALSFLEGCYEATEQESAEEVVYATGTTDAVGDTVVQAIRFVLDVGNESLWTIGQNVEGEVDDIDYHVSCISDELANNTHPVDATWLCDLDGDENVESITDCEFHTSCGCDSPGVPDECGVTPSPSAHTMAPSGMTTSSPVVVVSVAPIETSTASPTALEMEPPTAAPTESMATVPPMEVPTAAPTATGMTVMPVPAITVSPTTSMTIAPSMSSTLPGIPAMTTSPTPSPTAGSRGGGTFTEQPMMSSMTSMTGTGGSLAPTASPTASPTPGGFSSSPRRSEMSILTATGAVAVATLLGLWVF